MEHKKIYNTLEYKMSNQDNQAWAFTHPSNTATSEEAAITAGIDLNNLYVDVKTNTDEIAHVKVIVRLYNIVPDPRYKMVKDSKHQTVYLYKGSSLNVKSCVYFSHNDFVNSDGFKELKSKIDKAFLQYHDNHFNMLKTELAKRLPPTAKKAMTDLPTILDKKQSDDKKEKALYKWFQNNKFNLLEIKPEDFKEYINNYKKTGNISASWNITAKPDNFGHMEGRHAAIDFFTKRINVFPWSSSD